MAGRPMAITIEIADEETARLELDVAIDQVIDYIVPMPFGLRRVCRNRAAEVAGCYLIRRFTAPPRARG
jgi:hypothetical protein